MPSAEWDDDDPDITPPSKPGGLGLNLFFDLSGITPDAFWQQRAMRWSQASRDQEVYQQAMADVQQEAQGFHTLANAPAGRAG